jgi:FMN phosphatase YigB (HAD superfamily)
MTSFRAVLFDAGDTLVRLSGGGEQLLHVAAARLGCDRLDAADVGQVWRRVVGQASSADEMAKGRDLSPVRHRAVWTDLYARAGCDGLAPGLGEALYDLTVDPGSWEAFPDAEPTLRALKELGLPVAVVSDTGFDLRPVLDAVGLSPWLDAVVMSFELGVCKPDPQPFLTACERLGIDPSETLMAGICVLLLPAAPASGPRGLDRVLSLVSSRPLR